MSSSCTWIRYLQKKGKIIPAHLFLTREYQSILLKPTGYNHQFSDPSYQLNNWPQKALLLERNGTTNDEFRVNHSEKIGRGNQQLPVTSFGNEGDDLNPVKITVNRPYSNRVKRAVG